MHVEDYLELNDEDGIRIKGHRIWLNNLIDEIMNNQMNAEALLERFPTLNPEKIAAALAYLEGNKPVVMRLYREDLARKERNYAAHREEGRAMISKLNARLTSAGNKSNA